MADTEGKPRKRPSKRGAKAAAEAAEPPTAPAEPKRAGARFIVRLPAA